MSPGGSSGAGRRPLLDPRTRQQLTNNLRTLKRQLFGLSHETVDTWNQRGRAHTDRYGQMGLRAVPVEDMPAAIDELFTRMGLRARQRLLEIGPGAHGGMALIGALLGLDCVIVECDRESAVTSELLRLQLARESGAEGAAEHTEPAGSVPVTQIENLRRTIAPYEPLIAATGGALRVIVGDFADPDVQAQVVAAGPFDQVLCTDVIAPAGSPLASDASTRVTSEAAAISMLLDGLATAASHAQSLLVSFGIPEQSDEFEGKILEMYGRLERGLSVQGRIFSYDGAITPSSAGVARGRLYRLLPHEIRERRRVH